MKLELLEKAIIGLLKQENPSIEIVGVRGLVKTGENEWSFRYTFRDGNFLTLSNLRKIKLEGINRTPVFIKRQKKKKAQESKIQKKVTK